ncbi:MAG: hypothetical protein PHH85_02170 [Candidatus Methanoperedens sp.]|nr:hypothetical protein [Candidatus Methanoperedens sp.]
MRVYKKHPSPRSGSKRVSIKVFKETKELFEDLGKILQEEFEKWAEGSGVTVKYGTKGNSPTLANAVDVVAQCWETSTKTERSAFIRKYLAHYYQHTGD